MEIRLFNYCTNSWDRLTLSSDEDFDYTNYVGADNLSRNLYALYQLDGRTSLGAAIEVLEGQI